MHVVGHDDVGMQLVMAERAVVEQGLDEEVGDAGDLEDRPAITRGEGDVRDSGTG